MQNYKMTICYDGTRYAGWQKQKNTQNSIQEKVENVLFQMCGRRIEVFASGRTDAGVHAKGQTVSFRAETELACDEIKAYLNSFLPKDIAVTDVQEADERFHARLSAKEKTYLYRINDSGVSNVFERKYVYDYPLPLDEKAMRKAAGYLLGKHDFKAFSSVKKTKKSTVREVYDIKILRNGGEVDIFITANGFLYNMVRIITGTLIEVGSGQREIESVAHSLQLQERENAGYTVPPEGLTLLEVKY